MKQSLDSSVIHTGGLRMENKIKIFKSSDNLVEVQVQFDGETVWLTQKSIAELFDTTPQNITLHLRTIYNEKELEEGNL